MLAQLEPQYEHGIGAPVTGLENETFPELPMLTTMSHAPTLVTVVEGTENIATPSGQRLFAIGVGAGRGVADAEAHDAPAQLLAGHVTELAPCAGKGAAARADARHAQRVARPEG